MVPFALTDALRDFLQDFFFVKSDKIEARPPEDAMFLDLSNSQLTASYNRLRNTVADVSDWKCGRIGCSTS